VICYIVAVNCSTHAVLRQQNFCRRERYVCEEQRVFCRKMSGRWRYQTVNQLSTTPCVFVEQLSRKSTNFNDILRTWSLRNFCDFDRVHRTWKNVAVGCHYFPPGPQLPSQPLKGLLPVSLLGEQRHDGCEQFAWECYPTASRLRFEPRPYCARVQHANHSATELAACGD